MGALALTWDWAFEPPVMIGLLLAVVLYWLGARYMLRAGLIRSPQYGRYACYAGGLLAIFIALESPVDSWSDTYLWAHMIQHMLLIFVAAPLVILGAPLGIVMRAVPLETRRTVLRAVVSRRRLRHTIFAVFEPFQNASLIWILFVGDIILWHLPAMYDLALEHQTIHDVEHLCFLGTSLLFWTQVIPSSPLKPRLSTLERGFYLATAGIATTFIAMVYIYIPTPIYAYYANLHHAAGGLPLMVDQDAAGAIMNICGGFVIVTVFLTLFWQWLDEDERKTEVDSSQPMVGPGTTM